MHKNKSGLVTVLLISAVISVIFAVSVLKPENEYTDSERRKLASFPSISVSEILNGSFMSNFETYTLDQFPLRDAFRTLKAIVIYEVFRQSDNNGIIVDDDYAAKLLYPLNENSVINAGKKLAAIYNNFLYSCENIVYSVIPDKSVYMENATNGLNINIDKVTDILSEYLPFADYCDITDLLSLSDYYKTDTHWRQEQLIPTAEKLASALGVTLSGEYEVKDSKAAFNGVYKGQSALPLKSESLLYLTNEIIEAAVVYNFETDKTTGVYNTEKLSGKDAYEFFLSGSAPLLKITNSKARSDKKLIIFRDSFGSSLTPLLIEAYSEITVVDTRYISPSVLGNFISADGCDVLFIYSTLVLNDSFSLK